MGREAGDDEGDPAIETDGPPERGRTRTSDDVASEPRPGPEGSSVDDPDPPWIVERTGQVGVYLAIVAAVLAVVGVIGSWLRVQPAGSVAMVLAIVLVSVAMVLGMAFQAYVSDFPAGLR